MNPFLLGVFLALLAVASALLVLFAKIERINEDIDRLYASQATAPTAEEVSETLLQLQKSIDAKLSRALKGEPLAPEQPVEVVNHVEQVEAETKYTADPMQAFAKFIMSSAMDARSVEVCSVASEEDRRDEAVQTED